jgi:basic membrane protein A and related proteins
MRRFEATGTPLSGRLDWERGGNMKRRGLAFAAVIAAMALVVAACNSNTGTSASGSATGSALPGTGHKVCFVADVGGVNDKSFNQQIYEGLQQSVTDTGITLNYVTSKTAADYTPSIQNYVSEGDCDLIVLAGFNMGDALVKSAKANPDQKYAIVDYDIFDFSVTPPKDLTFPNVSEITFQTDQAAFLAGYLAAGMTKTGTVATYGGVFFPTVTIFMNGFAAGIDKYNKDNSSSVKLLGWDPATQKGVQVSTDPSVGFYTPAEGRRVAEDFISENADIILPVAGGTGIGTMAAAQDAGNVYGIWVDTDGCVAAAEYCSLFLTTVEKHMNVAVEKTVTDTLAGTFKGGLYVGTLENDGVGIADYHDLSSQVPQELQDKITELKQGIIDGSVSVDPADYAG